MPILPWIPLFLAVPMLWSSALRWWGLGLVVLGYCIAAVDGRLGLSAMIAIGLLLLAAYAVSPERKPRSRYAGHALFLILVVSLCLHWLSGFHNYRIISGESLTLDSVPFTMYLNLDKPLIGFWLLLVFPWVRSPGTFRASLMSAAGGFLIALVLCLSVALSLGLMVWAPKWPAFSGVWLVNNLLLVTMTEEVLFRGYIQGGLSRLLERWRWGWVLALCVAAALFGLGHITGGWLWVILGSLAGIGYGVAYRFGGLSSAIMAHFSLNMLHFFFFTYPMLRQTNGL